MPNISLTISFYSFLLTKKKRRKTRESAAVFSFSYLFLGYDRVSSRWYIVQCIYATKSYSAISYSVYNS